MIRRLGTFATGLGWRRLIIVLIGLLARIAVVVAFVPLTSSHWFAPFMEHFRAHPSFDPWQSFLDSGGSAAAFPYGPVMVAYYGVIALLLGWLPGYWGVQLGMALGTLALELVLWRLVSRWPGADRSYALVALAASPLTFYAVYVHGQLDMFPTVLMFASALSFRGQRWKSAGLFAGLAIATKFSSVLLAPLFLVFLFRNARYRSGARSFVLWMLPGVAISILPALLPGYRSMVLDTPVSGSAIAYAITLGPGLVIVVLPVVYAGILALQYSYKRGNPSLAVLCACLALTSVALLSPASPGWFVWSVPFLAVLASFSNRRTRILLMSFWIAATVTLALRASAALPRSAVHDVISAANFTEVGSFVNGTGALGPLLATATVGLGVVTMIMIYRHAMPRFNSYRLSSRPLSVAIAGDSGTGKDTLCVSLADVFGENATSFVMGDDYHMYDRNAPLWQVTTHLHPAANDLATMAEDTANLLRGRQVWNKHYDHARGTFTKQARTEAREFVVVNGLHALAVPEIVESVDLRIFMTMDEGLRRRLKIERDVGDRGKPLETVVASIEQRYADTERYIAPQEARADVVFALSAVRELPAESERAELHDDYKLVVTMTSAAFASRLQAAFVALGNCGAWLEYLDVPGRVRLTLYPGALGPRDIAAIASNLIERQEELFTSDPRWRGGSVGAIQLIAVLSLLDRRRSEKRF